MINIEILVGVREWYKWYNWLVQEKVVSCRTDYFLFPLDMLPPQSGEWVTTL